jgi:hypothetical protein
MAPVSELASLFTIAMNRIVVSPVGGMTGTSTSWDRKSGLYSRDEQADDLSTLADRLLIFCVSS